MTRLSAFRTSVHHHLIINNKLSNHNLYASNFNYVKFSPSLSLWEKKKKKDQNSIAREGIIKQKCETISRLGNKVWNRARARSPTNFPL